MHSAMRFTSLFKINSKRVDRQSSDVIHHIENKERKSKTGLVALEFIPALSRRRNPGPYP